MLEVTIAIAIIVILFAVLVPQLRALHNSWDAKTGSSEALQNGRILKDHLQRNLSSAKRITAVSDPTETNGYIEFQNSYENTVQYDINDVTNYVEFGPAGNLADVAGPVSQFQFTCYDACDLDTPLNPVADPGIIRFVTVQSTLTNSASMGQDLTLTTSAYLRIGAIGTEADANDNSLLLVTAQEIPSAREEGIMALIESWGYAVTILDENATQQDFDNAVQNNDVAFIPEGISALRLGTKLLNASIGVIIGEKLLIEDFGISGGKANYLGTQIYVVNNTHYITQNFSIGLVTVANVIIDLEHPGIPLAPEAILLAIQPPGESDYPALVTLDAGAILYGGGIAAGRRVGIPIGACDASKLTSDGKTLLLRSIEWAAGDVGGEDTYRDEFNASSYSGNDGTLTWSGDWIEINESDGATRGDEVVQVDPLASPSPPSSQLRVRDNDGGGEGIMRQANLEGAITATLSLQYRRENLNNAGDYVAVEVSTNGILGPWTEIVRFAGPDNESAYQPFSQDISPYIDADFAIRFISSPDLGNKGGVWFDDVEILLSL
jgi:hypothetical protein